MDVRKRYELSKVGHRLSVSHFLHLHASFSSQHRWIKLCEPTFYCTNQTEINYPSLPLLVHKKELERFEQMDASKPLWDDHPCSFRVQRKRSQSSGRLTYRRFGHPVACSDNDDNSNTDSTGVGDRNACGNGSACRYRKPRGGSQRNAATPSYVGDDGDTNTNTGPNASTC